VLLCRAARSTGSGSRRADTVDADESRENRGGGSRPRLDQFSGPPASRAGRTGDPR